jgi:hypothetical protein
MDTEIGKQKVMDCTAFITTGLSENNTPLGNEGRHKRCGDFSKVLLGETSETKTTS